MIQSEILNKSYYEAMILCNEYNQTHERRVYLIIEKINENRKFVKHIDSPYFIYLHLRTQDEEIVHTLQNILKLPYENERRHETYHYLHTLLRNTEYTKKMYIAKIL